MRKAWAIVEDSKMACFDYRLPIYWLRRLAVRDAKQKGADNASVVLVQIVSIPSKRKAKKK